MVLMERMLERFAPWAFVPLDAPRMPARVLDVGSRDINGSYVHCFAYDEYIGYDLVAGRNVRVMGDIEHPYWLPFDDEQFHLVICGQVLEHCLQPWDLVWSMARVLKTGGIMILIVPSAGPIHMQVDAFRYNPDGLRGLTGHTGVLDEVLITLTEVDPWRDCVGVFRKV